MKKNIVIIILVVVIVVLGICMYKTKHATPVPPAEQIHTNPQVQGKIDINAVCQGALAYMSFPDGASAEKFVAECKEGKHPEVIENFKKNLNVGDGAQI